MCSSVVVSVCIVSENVIVVLCKYFFFFKQKTAYEMLRSLVGSEMCIRDRWTIYPPLSALGQASEGSKLGMDMWLVSMALFIICLLYTSDAADDLLCVDLGGRRIIKKKKIFNTTFSPYTH